jgi:pimeloyl-ACP methyl ester carboxylesterase
METQVNEVETKTTAVVSRDGTSIVYEKTGSGPSVILVNGALSQRIAVTKWADMLAESFTVVIYDRRGRGGSTDTEPYAVEREIEDIEALINEAGGPVYLFGSSSGAALTLLAAETLGSKKVEKIALYEPPYGSGTKEEYTAEKNTINQMVKEGKPGDAVTFFMEKRGTPPDQMEAMKKSPGWNGMVSIGHTLVYDFEVLGDGTFPGDVARDITIPTLVMVGEKSVEFMHTTAETVQKGIRGAERKTIKGQAHVASPEVVVPVLVEFFGKQSS